MGSAFNLLRLGLFICFEVLIFLIYRNFLKIAHIGKKDAHLRIRK
jgi:hypothetical protein